MTANISSIHSRQSEHSAFSIEGESQELVDVLQKIVQNAGALLEVDSCSLALLDSTGSTLVTLAALHKQGRKPRHTRFQRNEGAAGWVAENRVPLSISDVSLDPRFKRLGRTPIGSMVCVPLMEKDNFIGTLTASSPEINAFSPRALQMLTIFAEQAVLAITNARQAELAQRQANQLEMLLDLSHGITTRLEADALYRTILANVRRLVPFQSAVVYLYDERLQELFPVAELSETTADTTLDCQQETCASAVTTVNVEREKISVHSTTSLAAWAAVHRHPMLRAPVKLAQDQVAVSLAIDVAEMAVPLVSKHTLYGVLVLQRAASFTSEELRLVRNLSNMTAAALENIELFHRVRTDQEQLRAILAASSDGIALVGANTCFIEANPAFGRIFGLTPEQIVGMECMELFCCNENCVHDKCRELCMMQQALQLEQPLPYVELDLTIKGIARSVGLSITPVLAGNKPLCLVIARDVTAIRDATRMKANFLSMITHELRSPLNAINGYLDLALTGIAGELNEQQREFVQRARAGSEHLYALVEDLLLVSRADAGQLRLNPEIVRLKEIVANAIEELELLALDNGISTSIDIPNDFPAIYADPVRVQQVLRNLISNALRFTPAGGSVIVSARVIRRAGNNSIPASANSNGHAVSLVPPVPDTPLPSIGSDIPGGMLDEGGARVTARSGNIVPSEDVEESFALVQVRDTGRGIAPEHYERIFERFYQIPLATSGRSSGQGLGLAIVKMIVELHGGQVMVESTPDQGSTFSFTLPGLLS